jgi:glucuronate isomerase
MKKFLHEDFLMQTTTTQLRDHNLLMPMPMIDFHNHLLPETIADAAQSPTFAMS